MRPPVSRELLDEGRVEGMAGVGGSDGDGGVIGAPLPITKKIVQVKVGRLR